MLNTGGMIAASIGGNFARPALTHPWIVRAFPIFETYPYLLPSVLAGSLPVISGILAIFFLKETLPPRKPKTDDATPSDGRSQSSIKGEDEFTYSSLFTWKITSIMLSFGMVSLLGTALAGLRPLYFFTSVKAGGVGFSSKQIGLVMTTQSISTIVIQLFVYPPLQRRVETARLYKVLLFFYLPMLAILPMFNIIARTGNMAALWCCIVVLTTCGSIGSMANGEPRVGLADASV